MRDEGFLHAAGLLPPQLRAALDGAGDGVEEIRLRTRRRVTVSAAGRERELTGELITPAHLRQVLENVTRSSLHSAAESLRHGYVTSSGGCRVGVCGTVASNDDGIITIREISSLSIRVAREHHGAANTVIDRVTDGGGVRNTLIISPPGLGKTTLLRDLVRQCSGRGIRVAIADERGELAGVSGGVPRFDVGAHTDVMTGASKQRVVMTLLRTMAPAVIALDEISEAEDAAAVELAANCGTSIFATVHGTGIADLRSRPVFAEIMKRGIFRRAVTITAVDGRRIIKTEDI
jgi:stage III sporulation protein AA